MPGLDRSHPLTDSEPSAEIFSRDFTKRPPELHESRQPGAYHHYGQILGRLLGFFAFLIDAESLEKRNPFRTALDLSRT